MNRSLRLLGPSAIGRPILGSSSGLARSSFLSAKTPFVAPQAVAAGPSRSKLPALYAPRVLGVRLYVSSSTAVSKEGKSGAPKERSTVGNALAEAKDVVSDLASIISGGQAPPAPTAFSGTSGAVTPGNIAGGVMAAMETSSHSHPGNVREDFMAVTTGLLQTVPRHVLLFGLAGTLPYLGTAFGTVFLAREANMIGNGHASFLNLNYDTVLNGLHSLEATQITYGAVILSFLGALHWGMEFVGFGGEQGYKRLMVGTLPLLFAFPTVFLSHGTALAAQWVGFTLTWFMDQRASQNGWTPPWFASYRFYLSIIVGFSIIGTLAGTSYYQEGAGRDFAGSGAGPDSLSATKSDRWASNSAKEKHRRESGKAKGGGQSGPIKGFVGGDIYVETDDSLEAYGRLKNRTKAAEEDEEEEEEEEEEGGEAAAEEGEDKEDDGDKEEKADGDKDESKGEPSEDNEGGAAGKSQAKKDNPNEKGAAGEKNTGLR